MSQVDFRDYYELLGVPRTATAEEIKTAYRRLARKYHPDVNPGDASAEARFKEINEANEVLTDPEKRTQYDAFGSNWRRTGSFDQAFRQSGVGRAGFGAGFGGGGTGFSDFFEALFGGATGSRTAASQSMEADVEERLEVTLTEVMSGGRRAFTVRLPSLDGTVRQRRIDVTIPAGVRDGQRLRIAGEGAVRADGSRGDLFLKVKTMEDSRFGRNGDDLSIRVEVGLTEAMLGAEVLVPTLEGKNLSMRVPPETSDGARLRLRGQGLPLPGDRGQGDMVVRIDVQLPKNLTDPERDLFRKLAELRADRAVRVTTT